MQSQLRSLAKFDAAERTHRRTVTGEILISAYRLGRPGVDNKCNDVMTAVNICQMFLNESSYIICQHSHLNRHAGGTRKHAQDTDTHTCVRAHRHIHTCTHARTYTSHEIAIHPETSSCNLNTILRKESRAETQLCTEL